MDADAAIFHDHPLAAHGYAAARIAGDFLLHARPAQLVVDAKSSPTDAVTQMDREAERLLTQHLLDGRPDDAIIGEEGADRAGTSGVRWIVDPLDGTVNYIYGLPMWGVSVAAHVAGELEIGIVIAPAFDEAFVAVRGSGAWHRRGGQWHRITMANDPTLAHALVATGFAYRASARAEQAAVIAELLPEIRDMRRMGACVIDLCWLALGRVDAYFEVGLNEWDYSAGVVIAREAGLHVTGLFDDEPSPEFLIAGPPGVHAALRAFFRGFVQPPK
jgi:myo-inositol-1(or 4)-monophosphatase